MYVTADCFQPDDVIDEFGCRICKAQATGYHFGAQSCSACAAFFRRTVALSKHFKCATGNNNCSIHYSSQICRACRFSACLAAGMKQSSVQPKKSEVERRRAFCTVSGLKRNKKFALRRMMMLVDKGKKDPVEMCAPSVSPAESSRTIFNQKLCSIELKIEKTGNPETLERLTDSAPPTLTHLSVDDGRSSKLNEKTINIEFNVFNQLIKEEMKIGERRRIMFCERPVGMLLGLTKTCPFTSEEIRPLKFRHFRKSIRTHILLVYEWLRSWPVYEKLSNVDRITILRNCVLYHTILDPSYITVQIGYPERFVMHSGGYISAREDSEEGWEDEEEISGETKKRIYKPLMRMMLEEIVTPMVSMKMSFEEFVALKGFISLQSTLFEVSSESRPALRETLNALCSTLHQYYVENNVEVAERFGNLILLLSNVQAVAQQFVERHHEIAFFDLWQLDSLCLQLLKKEQ